MAVEGEGGREAYTRAGDLRITPEGFLETGSGLQVLGDSGPISVPPASKLEIGADGTISMVPLGDRPNNLAVLNRIKLVKPSSELLEKRADGLIYAKDDVPLEASSDVRLQQGALEGSNVNTVEALVTMVELARRFDLQVKMMQTVDSTEAASAQLMRVG
jgi:flagellar basal-body rod protein FlgF